MNGFTKLALLCLPLTVSAASHSALAAEIDAQTLARLDALERENAALRTRVNRLESSKAPKIRDRSAGVESDPAVISIPRLQKAENFAADGRVVGTRSWNAPRFEISGSLLFLQPGAGNLEYVTLVNPLPPVSPHWVNQSLTPKYSPAFNVGFRYMADGSNDIALNWTHLNTTANAAVSATPIQMIGPPFLIGPESGLYKSGRGTVNFSYDSVKLDAGHTFCAECSFQLRAFGGMEFARLGQDLTGIVESSDGTAAMANTTHSLFTGAGPRLGMKGQYALGNAQFIGEVAGAALIGTAQSRIDFATVSPGVGLVNQSLTSPNATQVVPSIDGRLATAYTFPPSTYGLFTVELGYRAAVYFNAVSQYSLTQVPTSLVLPPRGIYLATAEHLQSNFTNHGPYLTGSWKF
jgi:Legionella pneumophila major outer membrane protein precursor